ncbi:MAG: thioredoxin family protein [Deltaproteobacteria bacterium]|nr:thioredoxin family protein [Deltaproteobacteria bacterium]
MPLAMDTNWDKEPLPVKTAFLNIDLDNFESEVVNEWRPVLLTCLHLSPDFKHQGEVLKGLSKIYGEALKVCLLDMNCIGAFRQKLGIAGTPTYLILHRGKEKGRMLGQTDRESLTAFVLKTLPQTKSLSVFV